jgi:tetratricopeptide (TPR) repeat protein
MKTALTVVFLVCSAALSGAQERLADQLRKGIVQEEANQNLDKAIKAYQAIVAQFDEDRKAAATALFRLAECYRKTGKREQAVAAYQRVVREFPDQAALVAPSRQQLASTYGLSERRAVPSTLSERRVVPSTRLANVREPREQAIQESERDLAAVQERMTAYQARIKAGVVSRDSAEYLQLQRELEAARQRLETVREREREVRPERPAATVERREVTPEVLDATRIEIDAMQKRLADMKQRVEVGVASPLDYQQLQAQFELLALRYKEQLKAREASEATARETRALNERLIKSVETEIALLTRWIDAAERMGIKGYPPDSPELLQLRRDLLGLQRKLDELKAAAKR